MFVCILVDSKQHHVLSTVRWLLHNVEQSWNERTKLWRAGGMRDRDKQKQNFGNYVPQYIVGGPSRNQYLRRLLIAWRAWLFGDDDLELKIGQFEWSVLLASVISFQIASCFKRHGEFCRQYRTCLFYQRLDGWVCVTSIVFVCSWFLDHLFE